MKTALLLNQNRFFSFGRIASAALLLTAAAAMAVFAASGPPARNFDVAGDGGTINTSFVPRSLSEEPMIVVVQLSGKSVAEVQADADRKLTKAEKDQIKAQLKGTQDGLRAQIESAGGKVLAQFQSALNGIKVQIPSSKLSKLSSLPGVTALLPVHNDVPENATSVPYIGAPTVWDAPTNFRGEGIKIGVIDTGIDYTHANFGGPGTPADYTTAHAAETSPADPLYFGPSAPKVKGGFDFVGDAYTGSNTPHPDPEPARLLTVMARTWPAQRRFRRYLRRSDVRRPLQSGYLHAGCVQDRPWCRTQGGPLLISRLRLHGLNKRHG